MFKTKARSRLWVNMGLFDIDKDPSFEIQYLTPAQRQRFFDDQTKRMFYHRPDTGISQETLRILFSQEPFRQEFRQVCQLLGIQPQNSDFAQQQISNLIAQHIPAVDYIERQECNQFQAMQNLILEVVTDWRNVIDEETGQAIPYSKVRLEAWVSEGEDIFLWFAKKLPGVFREFDDLLKKQQDAATKN